MGCFRSESRQPIYTSAYVSIRQHTSAYVSIYIWGASGVRVDFAAPTICVAEGLIHK